MKITLQTAALSAAASLALGVLSATAAGAKTTHHVKRTVRHQASSEHRTTAHSGATSKGGTMAPPTAPMANPAMSTAPATNVGDKM